MSTTIESILAVTLLAAFFLPIMFFLAAPALHHACLLWETRKDSK